jgi:hypothetical protein
MRTLKNQVKSISLFLAYLVLFQGCVVYHKTPTTLEQAQQEGVKTKITSTLEKTIAYKYITIEEGVYYGVNKQSGELVKTPLSEDYIASIYTKNEKASTLWTVIAIAVPVIFLVVGYAIAESGLDVGPGIIP